MNHEEQRDKVLPFGIDTIPLGSILSPWLFFVLSSCSLDTPIVINAFLRRWVKL